MTNSLMLGLAGHAFRAAELEAVEASNKKMAEKWHKKAIEYDNPFTDFINLIIADVRAKEVE